MRLILFPADSIESKLSTTFCLRLTNGYQLITAFLSVSVICTPFMLKVIFFLLVLGAAMPSAARQTTANEHQCLDSSSTAKRLALDTFMTSPNNELNPSFYVDEIEKYHTLVDVREQRADKPSMQVHIKNGLKIPIHLLKTKTYLKNKSLVVIDDGFNHSNLEQQVRQLHALGFFDVKILSDGVAGLAGTGYLEGEPSSIFRLRLVSAEKLFDLSLDVNNMLFVNLENDNTAFEVIGLHYLHLPYSHDRLFLLQLYNKISHEIAENENLRVVLSHQQYSIYREIIASEKLEGVSDLWYVKGGSNALSLMQNKIAGIEAARTKVKVSCLH